MRSEDPIKSTKIKPKYNWFAIIADFNLTREFLVYTRLHNSISLNRAARSFVKSKHLNYRSSKYFLGCCNLTVEGIDEEGCYNSPSMVEARKKIFGL